MRLIRLSLERLKRSCSKSMASWTTSGVKRHLYLLRDPNLSRLSPLQIKPMFSRNNRLIVKPWLLSFNHQSQKMMALWCPWTKPLQIDSQRKLYLNLHISNIMDLSFQLNKLKIHLRQRIPNFCKSILTWIKSADHLVLLTTAISRRNALSKSRPKRT